MKKLIPLLIALLPTAAFAEDHIVTQKGRRFNPPEVTINRGDSITFTNADEFIHQMYSQQVFDSDEKSPGETLKQPFARAGTFEVQCHIHPKMKLIVHVN